MLFEVTESIDCTGLKFWTFTKVLKDGLRTVIGACRPWNFEMFKRTHLAEYERPTFVWT